MYVVLYMMQETGILWKQHTFVLTDRCTHFSTLLVFFLQSAGRCGSLVSRRENQILHVCHSWSAVFLAAALAHTRSLLQVSWHLLHPVALHCVILMTRDLKTNICVLSVSFVFSLEIYSMSGHRHNLYYCICWPKHIQVTVI